MEDNYTLPFSFPLSLMMSLACFSSGAALHRMDASEVANCCIQAHYICNEWGRKQHLVSKL